MKKFKSANYENKSCVKEDTDYKLQLSDCLACSGCITDSEDLITKNNIEDIININKPVSFIISPQSKWSTYGYFNISNKFNFTEFENFLSFFLRQNFIIENIFDSSYATKIIGKTLINEKNKIISDCPGTVMYIERQGSHLVNNLSRIATAQQILSSSDSAVTYISVVPCYDKKLESLENSNLSFVITSHEFTLLLTKLDFSIMKTTYKCLIRERFQLNISNYLMGYLDYVLIEKYSKNGISDRATKTIKSNNTNVLNTNLEINKSKETTMNRELWNDVNYIKMPNLRDDVQYNFSKKTTGYYLYEFIESESTEVYARIIGVENLINFIKETKSKGLKYNLVEAYICNYGCLNGPGQLKFDNMEINIKGFSQERNNDEKESFKEIKNIMTRVFTKKEMKKVKFEVKW